MPIVTYDDQVKMHQNWREKIKEEFGVDLTHVESWTYPKMIDGFLRGLRYLQGPFEEAILKTENPEIKLLETEDGFLGEKFRIMKKDTVGGGYICVPPEDILIPDKKEMTINSKLDCVRKTFYFGNQERDEDCQKLPNLYKNITHALECFEHDVNGRQTHKLCIFDENGLAEERVIEETETGVSHNRQAIRNLLIRKTDNGTKISVEYEVKD